MSARFGGKRVLITGGTAGIGLAGARRIVEEGGQVIVTGRHPERIAAARDALPAATVLVNDAAAPDMADKLAEALGPDLRLDGLWLNAGEPVLGRPEDLDAEVFDRMMAVNVRGPALTLARLAPCLNAGTSVVVTSSSSVYEGAAATPLYAGANLRVRRRRGRKRAMGTRAPMTLPQAPNQRWSLDFVNDTLACGRRFRMLAVVDDFTRECLTLVADTSLSGARVGRELDAIIAARGKPQQNGYVESFLQWSLARRVLE